MLFRDTYTDGTPMTPEDKRDYKLATLASIGGVALLMVGIVIMVYLMGVSNVVGAVLGAM